MATETIRPARPDEATEVAACVHAAYARYVGRLPRPPAPLLIRYGDLIAAGRVYVASGLHGPRGVLVLDLREGYVLVENLAVHPYYQRGGLGRRLVRFVEDLARQKQRPEVWVRPPLPLPECTGFFRHLGYTEGEQGTLRKRLPAVA